MSDLQVKCTDCGSLLSLKIEWQGKTAVCPSCGNSFVVPQAEKPGRNVWALICGILGFVFCGCFGWGFSLAALIIGIVKKYKTGVILGIIGLCVNFIMVIVIILGTMLLPALNSARSKARQIACVSNMKVAMTEIYAYQAEFDQFPTAGNAFEWSTEYASVQSCFFCPESQSEYIYLGEGISMDEAPADTPLLVEYPPVHGTQINVGYLDGSVRAQENSFCELEEIVQALIPESASGNVRAQLLKNAKIAAEKLAKEE